MSIQTIPEIPRLYTALAEWGACLIYILPSKKRVKGINLVICMISALIIQSLLQLIAGRLPLYFWMASMTAAAILMFLFIYICCDLLTITVGYYSAFAFITAEFAASVEWQLHSYIFQNGLDHRMVWQIIFLFAVYGVVLIPIGYIEMKHLKGERQLSVSHRQMWGAVVIVITAFLISNISFVYTNTPFSGRLAQEIFYIRTLVDFSALVILYALREQYHQMHMKYELKAINSILHRQYEQYKQYKESIQLINRKYHDLKHQISIIREEKNEEKKAEYLSEIESGIEIYEAQSKTGNSVLDTVLTGKILLCREHDINITCVADGTLLDFMEAMDICSIFGNALDNAIESIKKLSDSEKRLIRVAVYAQNDLLMLRFENYYESELKYENGSLITTKKDREYHGYGIKSLRHIAKKYHGTMTINTENNWFTLRILIPVPKSR